jgi:hypothetical protein
MKRFCVSIAAAVWGCGAPPAPEPSSSPRVDAGLPPAAVADSAEPEATRAVEEIHPCLREIDRPGDVFPHWELLRSLPEEELRGRCDLDLLVRMARWNGPPLDLVRPIVDEAREDRKAFSDWVSARIGDAPAAAARAVAADVVADWEVGEDPAAVLPAVARWEDALSSEPPAPLAAALSEAKELPPLLERVNEVHRLRCLMEINPLGFAVDCDPIHPSGRRISLAWRAVTRDGVLERLELTRCTGKSCRKLRRTASEMVQEIDSLVKEVDALEVDVYRAQLRDWLALPPFRSSEDRHACEQPNNAQDSYTDTDSPTGIDTEKPPCPSTFSRSTRARPAPARSSSPATGTRPASRSWS